MTTAFELVYVRKEEEPVLAPPTSRSGVVRWLMARLFSSTTNTVLTVLCILLLVWIIPPLIRWAFIDAVWSGKDRDACIAPGAGACWAFVRARFGQFMYGRYPLDERWRVNLTGILLVIGLIPMAIPRVPFKRENAIYLLVLFPIAALILLTGGHFNVPVDLVAVLGVVGCLLTGVVAMMTAAPDAVPLVTRVLTPAAVAAAILIYIGAWLAAGTRPSLLEGGHTPGAIVVLCGQIALAAGVATVSVGRNRTGARSVRLVWWVIAPIALLMIVLGFDFHLTPVETPLWGGLLVTLVVAIVGIVASMPIGVVLALGRRSKMPVVRVCSTGFIEFVRGVPLITVLFMASVMLPVFLPPGVNFDKLLRALIGVALFSAAYMAEVVRGGLQAIPRGQYEAAHAVGLKYGPMMRLIILPQALKIVIPGIVNSFISLFKDTSLVLIIGIFDLLGIVQQGFSDANWAAPQTPATGYAFAALVFWVFCFTMSRYSIYTERRLHTGHKH